MSDAVAGKEAGKPAGKQKADKQARQAEGGKQAEAKPAAAHGHRPADERSAPPRLQSFYREHVIPKLRSELKIDNVMQVPRIAKITINMGVGEAVADKKVMDAAVADLTAITGQKPLVTKSRKAIASFKIRAGLAVGAKVTLRGTRMYEFLDRLISIAMPRIRDFRGVSARAFDGQGNYSLGVKEQIIFPEIQYDQIDQVRGMDITITTTAKDDRHGRALLEAFNFPFRK
ncbi:MAG: 50S ribosomal protein L5 [Gammaproteobacteria bacterium]|nr:50S ribosomal protein L5 [Gammaproteobacteria bacterium]